MPRVRVRIHPTGHLEVQVEGLADDRVTPSSMRPPHAWA